MRYKEIFQRTSPSVFKMMYNQFNDGSVKKYDFPMAINDPLKRMGYTLTKKIPKNKQPKVLYTMVSGALKYSRSAPV